jgi:hypothetical protein
MAYRSIVLINVVLARVQPLADTAAGRRPRVAVGLLPSELARPLAQIEPFGFVIVMALVMTGALGTVIGPVVTASCPCCACSRRPMRPRSDSATRPIAIETRTSFRARARPARCTSATSTAR